MTPDELLIATPVDGHPDAATVHLRYAIERERLIRGGAKAMPHSLFFNDDLARGRSRAVAVALRASGWKWMLWWDSDNAPEDPGVVPRMLSCAYANGHDMIAAPYPRKRMPPAHVVRPLPHAVATVNDCVEVACCGFGFVLTSRSCLERMTAHYAHEWYTDYRPDIGEVDDAREVVALFKQVHTDEAMVGGRRSRELLSEDHSFCYRWRAMGGKVQLYIGAGAPVTHIGGFVYGGRAPEWSPSVVRVSPT